MKTLARRRLAVVCVLILAATPAMGGLANQQSGFKTEHFKGKVVPLAAALAKEGVKLDQDAADLVMALVADDGRIYPLVKDTGSRMFNLDKDLRDRPMRLTGRLVPGSQMLQVVNVHSFLHGQLHEVYYWCDICSIRDSEPGDCHCCGAPFEFHEVPVR